MRQSLSRMVRNDGTYRIGPWDVAPLMRSHGLMPRTEAWRIETETCIADMRRMCLERTYLTIEELVDDFIARNFEEI